MSKNLILFLKKKGFCLHPLVTPSTELTNWFNIPFNKIRNRFSKLNSSRQTIIIIAIILFLISIIICLITISLRRIFNSRLSLQPEHNNVEYVMLQNVDDEDEESRVISTNGHTKSQTTISMNHVQET